MRQPRPPGRGGAGEGDCAGHVIATLTYDLGNAQLAKERSQNFDLSYKLQSAAWSARASIYRNTIKNFIYGASVDETMTAWLIA